MYYICIYMYIYIYIYITCKHIYIYIYMYNVNTEAVLHEAAHADAGETVQLLYYHLYYVY